jgi:beta-N-acetylhexosaminidase
MLIVGFPGSSIQDESLVSQWLATDGLGGVILFDKDLQSSEPNSKKNLLTKPQISQLNQALRHYASKVEGPIGDLPLWISIDYEGGLVDRLRYVPDCPVTIKPAELVTLPEEKRLSLLKSMATTLKDLGFNLNFAPLLDLNLNEEEGIIGKLGRCFSRAPDTVVRMAREFVEVFAGEGVFSCYKHFPGHGSAALDSHLGFVDVSHTFQHEELIPYQRLLEQKTKPVLVMTAHVINRELDPSGLPATLSYPILTECLRNQIGFDGVIVSDDLQMKAISEHFSLEESLKLSINAGADMLIFGNQLGSISATFVIDTIEKLVEKDEISMARIDESFERIIACKRLI